MATKDSTESTTKTTSTTSATTSNTAKTLASPSPETNLIGCDFDSVTAQAVAGKNIIAMVTDETGENLLAIAGQQGLSFDMSADSNDVSTKDDTVNGWTLSFYTTRTWTASVDGLYIMGDEASKMVAHALTNDDFLCLKICERTKTDTTITYKPLRMGLAIVSSDSFEAPNDDNMTYSMEFNGSGPCWLIETATDDEIEAATITVDI